MDWDTIRYLWALGGIEHLTALINRNVNVRNTKHEIKCQHSEWNHFVVEIVFILHQTQSKRAKNLYFYKGEHKKCDYFASERTKIQPRLKF